MAHEVRRSLREIISQTSVAVPIEAIMVVTRDGIVLARGTPEDYDEKEGTFAAMTATMLGAAETAASMIKKDMPTHVVVGLENGAVICVGAGNAFLIAIAGEETDTSRIVAELRMDAKKIKKLLG